MFFGLAFYGNLYLFRTTIGNSADVIAQAVQNEPSISTTDLTSVVRGAFANLSTEQQKETALGVQTYTALPTTLSSLPGQSLSSGGLLVTANPNVPENLDKPYWVAVVVQRPFPLARFFGFTVSNRFTMTAYAIARVVPSLIPRGSIMMWSGSIANIPSGWALCNGSNGTPNLLNRFIVGAGGVYASGDTGGADKVQLTVEEMPRHRHTPYVNNIAVNSRHAGNYGAGSGNGLGPLGAWPLMNETGGNQPHENRPPYFALAFIMKL